jgi:hypothetical protein
MTPSGQNRPDSETAEHVFAQWFRSLFAVQTLSMFRATLAGERQRVRRPPVNNITMRRVCKLCNNGWMSELEVAVEPIMSAVLQGIDVDELGDPELKIVAKWSAKTAITLSYTTPQNARVPVQASRSLHPVYSGPEVRFAFFYSRLLADTPLENGHLQVVYGGEVGLVGTDEVPGTRLILYLNGHALIIDFPPTAVGFRFNLTDSCASQLWPRRQAAGTRVLPVSLPTTLPDLMLGLCRMIRVELDSNALRA